MDRWHVAVVLSPVPSVAWFGSTLYSRYPATCTGIVICSGSTCLPQPPRKLGGLAFLEVELTLACVKSAALSIGARKLSYLCAGEDAHGIV